MCFLRRFLRVRLNLWTIPLHIGWHQAVLSFFTPRCVQKCLTSSAITGSPKIRYESFWYSKKWDNFTALLLTNSVWSLIKHGINNRPFCQVVLEYKNIEIVLCSVKKLDNVHTYDLKISLHRDRVKKGNSLFSPPIYCTLWTVLHKTQ